MRPPTPSSSSSRAGVHLVCGAMDAATNMHQCGQSSTHRDEHECADCGHRWWR